jgi:hypothetical protein
MDQQPYYPSSVNSRAVPPVSNVPQQTRARSLSGLWILGGVLSVALIGLAVSLLSFEDLRLKLFLRISPYIPGQNFVDVRSQQISDRFIVQKSRLDGPGFILLYGRRPYGTDTDIVLATYDGMLPQGTYMDVPIVIDSESLSAYGIGPGSHVYVAMYLDDGDGVLDRHTDRFVKNMLGLPVIGEAILL